ncbi:hypothetical protein T09_4599 [Trichinella sp. T9]|nr:hypothetical protein T09_4599 [Trichinella sp. T9]
MKCLLAESGLQITTGRERKETTRAYFRRNAERHATMLV